MKKPLKILTIALGICAVGLSTFALGGSEKVEKLFTLNEAEAICCPSPINSGRCSFTNNCWGDLGPGSMNDCDLTLGHCSNPVNPNPFPPYPPNPPLP